MDYLLEKGEILTLITAPAMEAVAVVSGRIWLTKYDDPSDYCLCAGSALSISTARRVVIEALEKTAVSVVWHQAPASLRVAMVNVGRCHCVPQTS